MWAKCAANRGPGAYGGEASIGPSVDDVDVKARMLSMGKAHASVIMEKATDAGVARALPPRPPSRMRRHPPDQSGWACVLRKTKGGCKRGYTDFYQSSGWGNYN